MAPFGLIVLVIGGLLLRQVVMGRVPETMSDLKELGTDLVTGNFDGAVSVLTSRGSGVPEVAGDTTTTTAVDTSGGSSALLNEAETLGNGGSYQTGGTGPHTYDCSGLVWKACYNLGIFTGSRFTTSTFEHVASGFASRVTTPAVGDIAVDPAGHHMGIVSGPDEFYSAMNPSAGIGFAKISTFKTANGSFNPDYWRVNDAQSTTV